MVVVVAAAVVVVVTVVVALTTIVMITVCYCLFSCCYKVSPGYRIAVVVTIYILPMSLELCTYIVASRKINQGLQSPQRSRHLLLFLKKSMNVFALIVITFNICGLPTSFVTIMEAFYYYDRVTPLMRYILDMIESIPCATTVICYSICSPKFRQEVVNLFVRQGPQDPEGPVEPPRWFAPGPESELRGQPQDKALLNATRRLDWIFGDDPSEIIVAATCPDTPLAELKDLPLAMTLGMKDRFQPIREDSAENSQINNIEQGEDTRPEHVSSTWPRRGDRQHAGFDRERRKPRERPRVITDAGSPRECKAGGGSESPAAAAGTRRTRADCKL